MALAGLLGTVGVAALEVGCAATGGKGDRICSSLVHVVKLVRHYQCKIRPRWEVIRIVGVNAHSSIPVCRVHRIIRTVTPVVVKQIHIVVQVSRGICHKKRELPYYRRYVDLEGLRVFLGVV